MKDSINRHEPLFEKYHRDYEFVSWLCLSYFGREQNWAQAWAGKFSPKPDPIFWPVYDPRFKLGRRSVQALESLGHTLGLFGK